MRRSLSPLTHSLCLSDDNSNRSSSNNNNIFKSRKYKFTYKCCAQNCCCFSTNFQQILLQIYWILFILIKLLTLICIDCVSHTDVNNFAKWHKFAKSYLLSPLWTINFINNLRAAFTRADPESGKKDSQVVSLFCAFGICPSKRCS